jgi:hypothetical protein
MIALMMEEVHTSETSVPQTKHIKHVKKCEIQVLTVASMKIRAFWDVALCSLGVDRRFRGVYCLHHQDDE